MKGRNALLTNRKRAGKRACLPLVLLVLLVIMAGTFVGCGKKKGLKISSPDQLGQPGCRIGVGLDCPEEAMLGKEFPQAKIVPYIDSRLAYEDLASGRLDAVVYARKPMELAIKNGAKGVRILDENYSTNIIAVGMSPVTPIPGFSDKLNKFIAEVKADGTLDDMYDRWVLQGNETMPQITPPKNPSLHLRVATVGTLEPYTYYVGTELNGYDIELAKRFAAWLGADLEFKIYDFGGIFAAAKTGDVDCIMSNLYYTPEHDESIPFSDPLFESENAIMVRADSSSDLSGSGQVSKGGDSFWSSIYSSFERTFIRENRWKLFLQGLGTTVLITVLTILLGTMLGFLVFMACRNGNPLANRITRFSVWLVEGMPVVVLLMILYYIIFGSTALSGTVVSVIGFTLVFGAGVYGMLKNGVAAIDKGQLEAAYTLGYSNRKAFFRIILPQALPHFMPVYKSEITSIIKATAVVGYIAVQDLTKMGDIIRSRTYEAFFPLIAVAVIYYILAAFLKAIVNWIDLRIDTRQRKPEAIRKKVEG